MRASKTKKDVLECKRQHSEGHAIAAPLLACTRAHCNGPCGDPNAGKCGDCQAAKCSNEAIACMADSKCDLLRSCLEVCGAGHDACLERCRKDIPADSLKRENDIFSCGLQYCIGACLK